MSRLTGWLLIGLAASLVYLLGYLNGAGGEQEKQHEADKAQLAAAFAQGQALGAVHDVVVTKYVDRVQVVKEHGKTIIKEVPVYVSKASDAACIVPVGFERLHDSAAANVPPVPDPAGRSNDAPSGISLSTVAETVADNYEAGHLNAEQLKALQEWAREVHAIATANQSSKK